MEKIWRKRKSALKRKPLNKLEKAAELILERVVKAMFEGEWV